MGGRLANSRDLVRAIEGADWGRLLPRLAAYAERRLRRVGWIHGEDLEPGVASVEDVVNTAIDRCLNGDRVWSTNASDDLEVFLKGVIKSIVWSMKKAAIRSATTPAADAGVDCTHDAVPADEMIAESGRCDVLAAAARCVEGDEDLEAYYLAVLQDGPTRDEIAKTLGWAADKVTAARIKLQRRLVTRFPDEFAKYKKKRGTGS